MGHDRPQPRVGYAGVRQGPSLDGCSGRVQPNGRKALQVLVGDVAAGPVQLDGGTSQCRRLRVVQVPGPGEPPPRERDLDAGVPEGGGRGGALAHRRRRTHRGARTRRACGRAGTGRRPRARPAGRTSSSSSSRTRRSSASPGPYGGQHPHEEHLDQDRRCRRTAEPPRRTPDRWRHRPSCPSRSSTPPAASRAAGAFGTVEVFRGLGQDRDERVVLDAVLAPGPDPGPVEDRCSRGHHVPALQLPGQPDRAVDRLACLCGPGEPQQRGRLAAPGTSGGGRVRWGVGHDLAPQVERLGVRVPCDRDLCRAGEPVARACGVLGTERCSEVGVVRDRGARVGVVGMMLLDHPSRAVVQSHLASRAELAVHRLARQRVHEGVARVLLLDQATGHREVQQVEAARRPASPASSETRSGSIRRPSTAAAVSTVAASSGSRATRCRRTSRMPSGTGGRPARRRQVGSRREQPGVLQDEERVAPGHVGNDRVQPGVVLLRPSSASARRRRRCRARPAGSARLLPARARPSCRPAPARWWPPSYAGCRSPTTGARRPDPARWLSSCSDVASAQWRSSSTSNSGVSSAERCTSSTTASNIRRPVPPPLGFSGQLATEEWVEPWVERRRGPGWSARRGRCRARATAPARSRPRGSDRRAPGTRSALA